jgi:hypothetical protein
MYIPDGVIMGALAGFLGALIGMSLPARRFGRSAPKQPMTPEQRRDFWTVIAVVLVTFGGGIFVHPLFLVTMPVWVRAVFAEEPSVPSGSA